MERARHYGAIARDAMAIFPDSDAKSALLEAIEFSRRSAVLERSRLRSHASVLAATHQSGCDCESAAGAAAASSAIDEQRKAGGPLPESRARRGPEIREQRQDFADDRRKLQRRSFEIVASRARVVDQPLEAALESRQRPASLVPVSGNGFALSAP